MGFYISMYRVHVPGRLTDDEASHLNQVLAKHDESFGNGNITLHSQGIPPFDKNFRQRFNLMQRMRFLSQRQQYSAFVHRSEIASLITENSFLTIHCDPHPIDTGVATQVPQIIAEIDAHSDTRIFVIRSNDVLCDKACDVVKREMCLEDTPTVQTYHPIDEHRAQSDTKIVFLTVSSFLHLMLVQKDPECTVILEDVSVYYKLKDARGDLGAYNLRTLANYELLWGIVQQLALNSRFRFVMCAPQRHRESTVSLISALTQSCEKIVPLAFFDLNGTDGERSSCELNYCPDVKKAEFSFLQSLISQESDTPGSLDVILTDDVNHFVLSNSNFFHTSPHPLFIHPSRKLLEHEVANLEKQNMRLMSFSECLPKSTRRHVILADFFDASVFDTIYEVFGSLQIRTISFVQLQSHNSMNFLNTKKSLDLSIVHTFLQDISQRSGAKIKFDGTTTAYLCKVSQDLPMDSTSPVLEEEDNAREIKTYFCMMKRSFELQKSFDYFISKTSSIFAADMTRIDTHLMLRRTISDNGSVTSIGKAECVLSYLTTNTLIVRLLIFAAWFSCPTFGCLTASLLSVNEKLHGTHVSREELVDLVQKEAAYFLSHLRQRRIIQHEFCKNNIMLHRCAMLLSFFPDIALPEENQNSRSWYLLPPAELGLNTTQYLHASFDNQSGKLVPTTKEEQDIYPFTHIFTHGQVRYLVDSTGGYFTDIGKFYEMFFPLDEQQFPAQYSFNNFPVFEKVEKIHFYNTMSVIILLGPFLKEIVPKSNYLGQQNIPSLDSRQLSKKMSSFSRGWVGGFSRSWSHIQSHDEDISSKNSIDLKLMGNAGKSFLVSEDTTVGSIAVAQSIQLVMHNNAMLTHLLKLRECFDIFIEKSIYSPFPLEFLQVIDWTLQKCFLVEDNESKVEENVFWKRFNLENSSQGIEHQNIVCGDRIISPMSTLMIEKFTQSVAALQDRSFESFCREFLASPGRPDTTDQTRYMLSFLDQGNDTYSAYEARLLAILPNMPKFHVPFMKELKEMHMIQLFSRGLSRFVDEFSGEAIQQQRKKLRADRKHAKKAASKDLDDQESASEQLKTISILSDITEGDMDQRRKTVNTNVELLHATERELVDAAAAVLVEPLPLKKATNLNLPLILAKALGEILDAKVGPTCLLSDYAHIQVPSKKVADAAMKLGCFMCLGEMVHIHKNCYIVRHKNDQLTRKLDVIRSKGK